MKRALLSTTAVTAALALVALPTTAYADPTDPAPGWRSISTPGSVNAQMGGDGGAHVAYAADFDTETQLHAFGPDGQLRDSAEPVYGTGLLATGSADYAINLVRTPTDSLAAQTYSEGAWRGPIVFADASNGIDHRWFLDANSRGNAVTTWVDDDGQFHAAVLPHDASWKVSTPPVVDRDPDGVYRFRVAKPVINEAGKTSLVWFEPGAKGGELMRSVLPSGSTRWSTARPIATLASDPATLVVASDGQGRETVAAGSLVWRQVHTNSGFRFQFQAAGATSVALAASGRRTRVAWMVKSGHTFTVKTRLIYDAELRPTKTVWTKVFSKKWRAGCFAKAGTLVAVSPQGRSYLAWAVDSPYGLAGCPEFGGGVVARVTAINGADREVGAHNVSFLRGSLTSLSVTGKGPVALSYIADYNDNGWGTTARSVFLTR